MRRSLSELDGSIITAEQLESLVKLEMEKEVDEKARGFFKKAVELNSGISDKPFDVDDDDCWNSFMDDEASLEEPCGEGSSSKVHTQYRIPQTERKELYEEYVVQNAFGKSLDVLLSPSAFYEMWRDEYSYVKCSRTKGTHAMCSVCSDYTGALKNAKTDVEREDIIDKRMRHREHQRMQRIQYYKHRYMAINRLAASCGVGLILCV